MEKFSRSPFTKVVAIFVFLVFLSSASFSQNGNPPANSDRHFVGVQLNPYLGRYFFDNLFSWNLDRSLWVASLRYGQEAGFLEGLILGGEVNFHRTFGSNPGFSVLRLGPFARYSQQVFPWAAVFAEASPIFSYLRSRHPFLGAELHEDWSFFYYVAPGISLRRPDSRFSFDLYWKFSGEQIIDGRYNVFSFNVNFHF